MRRRMIVVFVCALLGFPAIRPALAQESPPDGMPDIHGTWSGKAQAVELHLGGTEKNGETEAYPLTLSVAQSGADITIDVTLMRDEGPLAYRLVGKVGRGRLWGQGTDIGRTGNALVIEAGVNAKGTVMKGTELLLFDPPLQVKFKAKKQ